MWHGGKGCGESISVLLTLKASRPPPPLSQLFFICFVRCGSAAVSACYQTVRIGCRGFTSRFRQGWLLCRGIASPANKCHMQRKNGVPETRAEPFTTNLHCIGARRYQLRYRASLVQWQHTEKLLHSRTGSLPPHYTPTPLRKRVQQERIAYTRHTDITSQPETKEST